MTLTSSHGSSTSLHNHPYTLSTLPRSRSAPPRSEKQKQRPPHAAAAPARAEEGCWWWIRARERIVHDSKYGPLLAAVAAPISTLLDIPALCESWLTLDGATIRDPRWCIALSSVSLTMNVLANLLLVRRFTVGDKRWRAATIASVICWCIKLMVAIVNLSIFGSGRLHDEPKIPGIAFGEGFWCAVASCCISGLIVAVLVLHGVLRFDKKDAEARRIRVVGAEFILVVMTFVILMGLEALAFSQLEGWTYFTGIYFSLITVLTIGFGDVVPKRTVSRIILFPFSVVSIALLAVLVGVFVDFLSNGTRSRQKKFRERYESKVWSKRGRTPTFELRDEIKNLRKLEDEEDFLERMYQLVTSTLALLVFWVVGAAVFHVLEGFAFGSSLYFCYIFFLTIGYGDFAPSTPGGRVFFVVYAIIAVPFVTNFVLNTVSSVMYSITSTRFRSFRVRHLVRPAPHRSHADFVADSHRRLEQVFPPGSSSEGRNHEALIRVVLGLALRLESEATTLLISALEKNGRGHFLLRADRNLQMRALEVLAHEPEYHAFVQDAMVALDVEDGPKEERHDVSKADAEELALVAEYRKTFAGLLAAGSMLLGLEGNDQYWFERRLEQQEKDIEEGVVSAPDEVVAGEDAV